MSTFFVLFSNPVECEIRELWKLFHQRFAQNNRKAKIICIDLHKDFAVKLFAFVSCHLRICPSASPSWLYCWLWHECLGEVQAVSGFCWVHALKWNSGIYTCWIRTKWHILKYLMLNLNSDLDGSAVYCSTLCFITKACQTCSRQDTCRVAACHALPVIWCMQKGSKRQITLKGRFEVALGGLPGRITSVCDDLSDSIWFDLRLVSTSHFMDSTWMPQRSWVWRWAIWCFQQEAGSLTKNCACGQLKAKTAQNQTKTILVDEIQRYSVTCAVCEFLTYFAYVSFGHLLMVGHISAVQEYFGRQASQAHISML